MSGQWPADVRLPYENRFGLGYKILFWICFATVMLLFLNLFFASTDRAEVRAFGLVFMGFGGSFLAAIIYQAIVIRAFSTIRRIGGEYQSRTITPQSNPVRYLLTLFMGIMVAAGLIAVGVWIIMHGHSAATATGQIGAAQIIRRLHI